MSTTVEATTTIPVRLRWPDGEDITDLDVADAVIVGELEQVDIGGAGVLTGTYLRVTGPDLVVAAEALRRLADRIIDAVLDARQERIEAEQHECYCGARLDPDEITCGALRCQREWRDDRQGLIP